MWRHWRSVLRKQLPPELMGDEEFNRLYRGDARRSRRYLGRSGVIDYGRFEEVNTRDGESGDCSRTVD